MVLELVPGHLVFVKNEGQYLLENGIFETSWFYSICNSKNINMCQNQQRLFTGDSLKIKMDLELVPRPHFCKVFLIVFVFSILHKLNKLHYQTVFALQVIY